MPRIKQPRAPWWGLILCLGLFSSSLRGVSFVNFETAPVHPLAIAPDAAMLAACNLPDNRVELFQITTNGLSPWKSIPVGLDPVTARFRTTNELWVINHISRSISIIDLRLGQLTATVDTFNAPEDVIFTPDATTAFVSCSKPNTVEVFDADTRKAVATIPIEGDRPKSMALSPDGSKPYVAIFESGNGSTFLGRRMTHLDQPPAPTVVDLSRGPHAGQSPPPNSGTSFSPAIRPELLGTNTPPRAGLIVKKNPSGKWMDDNGGDWSEYVSGSKAAFTERFPGWDLPDHDIAVVDFKTSEISYITGLMNICMDLAVNPVTGRIALVGTDGINEVRFEPVLKGVFARIKLALVDGITSQVKDLNPHLDYKTSTVPRDRRNLSIGDPRGVVWNSAGTRLYVTGMGSGNVVMLDQAGNRVGTPLPLPDGPVGLAFDSVHNRLYALSRFDASLSVIHPDKLELLSTIPLFDPTPRSVRAGRKHLYDTHKTSGLGQLSCGSCHVNARLDRLAWDLGTQIGEMKLIGPTHNLTAVTVTNHFHPMKGPMVTQTLQDIIGHEPFHWRGDRDGIEEFNGTFRDLQAADFQLTPQEMKEFKDFLGTITFPPNPLRNFDNSLSTSVPLPGHLALGRGTLSPGDPLPAGNARNGLLSFNSSATNGCVACHTMPTGLGADALFVNGRWQNIPLATNAAHHALSLALDRTSKFPFKVAQLRSLPDKIGFSLGDANGTAGFGFLHDGAVDSLTRFLQDGFDFRTDRETADLIAFLLSFTGSDLPVNPLTDSLRAPGLPSRDVPAAVGRQFTMTNPIPPALMASALNLALSKTGRVELVAKGFDLERSRGWWFDPGLNKFRSDRAKETRTWDELRALADPARPLTVTVVPAGCGTRIGIDRDLDGVLDQDELDAGSDPANPLSVPGNQGPSVSKAPARVAFVGGFLALQISAMDPEGTKLFFSSDSASPPGLTVDTSGLLEWHPTGDAAPGFYTLSVLVRDEGQPPLTNRFDLSVELKSLSLRASLGREAGGSYLELSWDAEPGRSYLLEAKLRLQEASCVRAGDPLIAQNSFLTWRIPLANANYQFYRIRLLP